jgi:hypothetical protein
MLAESIANSVGRGQVEAFSAGVRPASLRRRSFAPFSPQSALVDRKARRYAAIDRRASSIPFCVDPLHE